MPPPAKRDCGVILLDVNASNKDDCLAALMKICTFNWLSGTKDTYRIILSNTKDSKNTKNYSNLYDTGFTNADPQPIFNCITNIEAEEGDWLNALLLAINHVKEAYELPGVITLQILYITKLDGCSQNVDMVKVEQIINDLREYDIFLYIIGPDVKLPYTITEPWDVSDAMKEGVVDESKPVLAAAKRIIDATTNSVMCNLKVGINLFFSFRHPRGTQPWKVPLSFGSKLEIPANTVRIYKREPPFKLSGNNRFIKHVLLEDESVSVDSSTLISGIERHGKFVKDESRMFRVEGPRSFAVLGFAPEKTIPEYYLREGTYMVLPDPDKPNDCAQAFYNLVDVLAEDKKYAIARRVYNANNKPKYVALIPQPDSEPKCFAMAELPYADDLKQKIKFTEPVLTEEVDEDDVITKYLNVIDIWSDNCKTDVPLGPKMMLDYYVSRLANAAVDKYLDHPFYFDSIDVNDLERDEINEVTEAARNFWTGAYGPRRNEGESI